MQIEDQTSQSQESITNKSNFLIFLMLFGILLFAIGIGMIYFEMKGAKGFCKSQNAEFSFTFNPPEYKCDGKVISRYDDTDGKNWEWLRPEGKTDIIWNLTSN